MQPINSRAPGQHHNTGFSENNHEHCTAVKEVEGFTDRELDLEHVPICEVFGIQSIDKNGCTPLHRAVYEKNLYLTKLRLYLKRGLYELLGENGPPPPEKIPSFHKGIIDMQDNYGMTALHLAALMGQEEIFYLLINPSSLGYKKGANIHIKDNDGDTALHLAAGEGHTKIALKLAEMNLSKDSVNNKGLSPADLALLRSYDCRCTEIEKSKYQQLAEALRPKRGILDIKEILSRMFPEKEGISTA